MAELRTFTVAELSTFNGLNDAPVYFSVMGKVFDVTSGRTFYGPGGPYAIFAGRECARALAMMKIEVSECTDDVEGLDEKQRHTLEQWIAKFESKYPLVGTLIKG
mmetsp:Transcript_10715/g.23041  ORF Transcript_10715/g.23041 Transcript_10715/m.23041 type:complete len:105 (+) Transcript_10715:58-372(+)